jgi:formylglycine-generating enzyme required for sulfatase activity
VRYDFSRLLCEVDTMADVFLSYRNTPDRRAIVRRLATVLRAYGVTVWWDYGLEAGESYRAQIMSELASARIVAPLWCAESVQSPWVRMEATFGKDKLLPLRLQSVAPPDVFEAIQSADLIGWDGAVGSPRLQEFVRLLCKKLGRPAVAPTDLIEELSELPPVKPLPEVAAVVAIPSASASAGPAHDYAFWERQWEKLRAGTDLTALRAMATEAPRYFADQARARIAAIEAAQRRQGEERHAQLARYRAEGRIKVDARIVHGAPEGWFKSGCGKSEPGVREAEWFKDIDIGPEMVVVPAGEFLMGSNKHNDAKPLHRVHIMAPFAVGRFAVTFAQWDAARLAHKPSDQGWGRTRRPVIDVSWEDAKAYVGWLSQRTGREYRLLSEAEWEYCCRAGTTTRYAFGDSIAASLAQFSEGKAGSAGRTVEVGTSPPNAWGLYDMHGNVWEWCADNWHGNYKGAPQDGTVWAGGDVSLRVVRGGSWNVVDPDNLRSAVRYRVQPHNRYNDVGFRVARALD